MKLYNWIDSFLDSKQKRRNVFLLLCLVYWLWQNIWQAIFYFQLFKISNYESLFNFLENMNQYNQSVLVKMIYEIVTTGNFDVVRLALQFHFLDLIIIFITVLFYKTSDKKKRWRVLISLFLCLMFYDIILLALGFQQGSLSGVVNVLHWISIGSLAIESAIIAFILMGLIEKVSFSISQINVHES